MDPRTPITLITGFLGSGKTTLLRRLLGGREGLFVLVNEFGEVPLDHLFLEGKAEALADGCLCCGLEGALVEALALLRRRGGFTHLLLETSGLAHPAPILRVLLSPGVREAYRLAGVVTLVDPLHLRYYLHYPEAKAQVRYADLLLLTKADQAEEEELAQAEALLRAENPLAPLRRTALGQGVVPEEVLFPRESQGFFPPIPPLEPHVHEHQKGLVSVNLVGEGAIPYEAYKAFMEDLVFGRGVFSRGRLVRSKGEVNLEGSRSSIRFHGVYGLFSFEKGPPWPPGPRLNRLVFIGEGLPGEAVRERFFRILRP
ncbi:MAG: GTP-binding protein [Thermus sp.]|uniref:CobW family GTP-binding protein n=2 Tax=Thermus sp. TaxID=275 RepID=UPI0025CDFE91|nr:GTP-binding protein [Thermus sp.]MCS6869328.1 GTP-binding protein [Thermus sp.]MDW8018367.1 GTP-binding protein [Thermus sp.]MDW8358559.1 GTP-binding protein [Thermus sp.]